MRLRSFLPAALIAAATTTAVNETSAFSTRVHIMISNKVREALIQNGKGEIPLWGSGGKYAVKLADKDVKALTDHPESFRAGAIGPDNMAFPGMTDPSHALHQRPFEQCQRLYDAAILDEERAYAMGCFLHGSTDAIAHHYVNFMSGETFTLTPITSGRDTNFINVVRHIIAEEMIQEQALAQNPSAFTAGELAHTIPHGFILRTYFNTDSAVYDLMGRIAGEEFAEAKANDPGATLPELLYSLDVAPADHLILAPVYIQEIDAERIKLRQFLETEVARMQDWSSAEGSQLQVQAGADGKLGTQDDYTECDVGCPSVYAKYMVFAGLLAPRFDAGGTRLPSAWEKLSEKFKHDLDNFMPSFVQVIDNVSRELNTPLGGNNGGIDDIQGKVGALFAPMTDWSDEITTIDTQTIAEAITPEWLEDLQELFQNVGINIDIAAIIEALLDPILEPIRQAIRAYVIDLAKEYLGGLVDIYKAELEKIKSEYTTRLEKAAPDGVKGTSLDFFFQTGLYGHAFNIAAAALANHQVVLPVGDDPIGIGPASFDCSYTAAWMQAEVCDYLSGPIFPMGVDVAGSLSLMEDGVQKRANLSLNSPIECHDQSLFAFAEQPTVNSCKVTDLDSLRKQKRGTVSRAIPPELSGHTVECTGLTVDGLPGPGEGSGSGSGSGAAGPAGGSGGNDPAADEGCGCRTAGAPLPATGAAWMLGLLAAGAGVLRRRRRSSSKAAVGMLAAAAFVAGCSSEGTGPAGTDNSGGGGGGGESSSTTGKGGSSPTSSNTNSGVGAGPAGELLAKLGQSRWNAVQFRDGQERGYELHFDASRELWAEVRNPYGPARKSETRQFVVAEDGRTVTTVESKTGDVVTWLLDVTDGNPRSLRVERDGNVEFFDEGEWPKPTTGLTADVRVFKANGPVEDAFCMSGASAFDWQTIYDFARGLSAEPTLGEDRVAGAPIRTWHDFDDQFAVTDVDGFDRQTLGGSELTDQNNFFVWYRGTIQHPGGTIEITEADDDVEDGVIVLLGDDVGKSPKANKFFPEDDNMYFIHGFVGEDDEYVTWSFPPGDVPIEVIMIRCNVAFIDVDLWMALDGGDFYLVGDQPMTPRINDELFPPPF